MTETITRPIPIVIITLAAFVPHAVAARGVTDTGRPPKGFVTLFNGKDLSGWRGLGHTDPREIAKWTPEQRKNVKPNPTDFQTTILPEP